MADETNNNGGLPAAASLGEGASFDALEFGAEQPIHERLKYETNLHRKVLTRLVARRDLSIRGMGSRTDDWERVDEHCRLFLDLSRPARKADGSTDTTKKEMPFDRAIVVPLSYALLWADLTQILGIFLRRDPPIEVTGTGPDDVKAAALMNVVLGYDQVQSNYVLQLFQVLMDSLKYGRGFPYDTWEDKYGWKTGQRQPSWGETALSMVSGGRYQPDLKRKNWEIVRQFCSVSAIDPFLSLTDPRVSLSNMQDAEYCGHDDFRGYNYLLKRAMKNGGPYFNVEFIPTATAGGATRQQTAPTRNRFTTQNLVLERSADELDRGFHQITHVQVEIVPKDWELGAGDVPEKWWFSFVDNQVIIRAHPSQYEHDEFTYAGAESNPDLHVSDNPGSIELHDGSNRMMNWGFNSHIENTRRFLNNSMIYLPSLIEEADLLNPDAGGHIRGTALLESLVMEGRMSVDQAMHQIQLADVTMPWLQNINFMLDFSMRMEGVADASQAQVTKDKRTLGEIQEVTAGSSARMALRAALLDVQAIRPMALRMIQNRQQFTTGEQYYRITGDLRRMLGAQALLIRPDDIQGNLDYLPKTGPTPREPDNQWEAWQALAEVANTTPALQAPRPADGKMLDAHAILDEAATRSLGIRNLDSFYYDPIAAARAAAERGQVVDDGKLDESVRKGDVVPAPNGRIG